MSAHAVIVFTLLASFSPAVPFQRQGQGEAAPANDDESIGNQCIIVRPRPRNCWPFRWPSQKSRRN